MAASTGLIPKQEARVQDQIWKMDHVIYSAIIAQGTQTGKSNNVFIGNLVIVWMKLCSYVGVH